MKIFANVALALMASTAQAQMAPVASAAPEIADQHVLQRGFMTPILYKLNGNHERLFVAVFDCSWKNARNGPTEPTTVSQLYDQLKAGEEKWHDQIHAEYVETDCARDNWYTSADEGKSVFDARLEQMYGLLGRQVTHWLQQDPQAQIRILDLGGSWGALQAAGFSHVVDRRGIRASSRDGNEGTGSDGLLLPAGQTAQVVALLDPVGAVTDDVRLPPSVISGIQLTAQDEHRGQFKSDPIIGPGITPEGRLAGLPVPGAHSDVCGGYNRNGLSIRTGNFIVDYINGLADQPLLQKQAEPTDPRLNVIHHSEEEGQ